MWEGIVKTTPVKGSPRIGMMIVPYENECYYPQWIVSVIDDETVLVNDQKDGLGFGRQRKFKDLFFLSIEFEKEKIYHGKKIKNKQRIPVDYSQWAYILENGTIVNKDTKVFFEPIDVMGFTDYETEFALGYIDLGKSQVIFTQDELWDNMLKFGEYLLSQPQPVDCTKELSKYFNLDKQTES